MNEQNEKIIPKTQIEIPVRTYLNFVFFVLICFALYKLTFVLLLSFISLLIAVTMTRVQGYLISKGWKKSIADTFLVLGMVATIGAIIFGVLPTAVEQLKDLFTKLPQLELDLARLTPKGFKLSSANLLSGSPSSEMLGQAAAIANSTLSRLFEFALMLIVAVYMFLDGKRAYNWILAFYPESTRNRIDRTAGEISPIVEAYIIGQATTSTIAAIWVFTAAYMLDVPAAFTLAVLAAIFDILPGIGFVLNVVTGTLLALTVSVDNAIYMMLSLITYCAIENYILIPYIYGNRLKLSPLVVLMSLIVSGAIAGLPGMIAILPIVAAYETIERVWLKRRSGMKETVELHQAEQEVPK